MPSRKRPKEQPVTVADDPVKRFAAAVRESEARERDRRRREQRAREDAAAAARRAAEHAAAVEAAERELRAAIEDVRAAKRNKRGTAEADGRWKLAKARVIELQTGAPPAWADTPGTATADEALAPES